MHGAPPGVLVGLLVTACAHARGPDCAGLSREQCVWARAEHADQTQPGPIDEPETGSTATGWESESGWTRMERMLQQAVGWLADGLGGPVTSQQARTWCAGEPTLADREDGATWVCHLEDPPRIADREFTLEGSAGGVLAVTARDFDGEQSRRVVELAMRRWRGWCVESRFSAIERTQNDEFHRCALPGGPLLVVGRFAQDLDADLWQVSLTVMGAR